MTKSNPAIPSAARRAKGAARLLLAVGIVLLPLVVVQEAQAQSYSVVQLAQLTASDAELGDNLGAAIAISGNTVAVGAPDATVNGNADQGAVYLFVKRQSGWRDSTQIAKLTASDGKAGSSFGESVSVDGNTVVVGAPHSNQEQGAVYVFVKPSSGWTNTTETAKLTASDGLYADGLGASVSISNNIVVAGAPNHTVNGNSFQGAAYVFVQQGTTWSDMTQQAELTAADGAPNDLLGSSVAANSSTIAVGAPQGTSTGYGSGKVYVFAEPTEGWVNETQTAELTALGGGSTDGLGLAVGISGNTVVGGAPFWTNSKGVAYLFVEGTSGWSNMTQTAKLAAVNAQHNGAQLGQSISISGNVVIVGAPYYESSEGYDIGAVYEFMKPASGWRNESANVLEEGSGTTSADALGYSVGISGQYIVSGAPSQNSGKGVAYVYGP